MRTYVRIINNVYIVILNTYRYDDKGNNANGSRQEPPKVSRKPGRCDYKCSYLVS